VAVVIRLSKKLVLASSSPRRIQLLRQLGLEVEVSPGTTDETFDPGTTPEENVRRLALAKATECANSYDDAVIVGADTTVVLDGEVMGKPLDVDEAKVMLRALSERTHVVFTGVALVDQPSRRNLIASEATEVTFRKLSEKEIEGYVSSGSPFDKAGGYGIQDDYGAVFVTRVNGCFYNVMGFPVARFYSMLEAGGFIENS